MENDLQFRGGNPGAVQFGNFMNYYQFHSPKERIKLLPKHIWKAGKPCVVLDIGCNSGILTEAIKEFLKENIMEDISILAVDIDPLLITRAKENSTNDITFHCLDIMDISRRDDIINEYLKNKHIEKFSVVFCFSTTMWIHLNYGDGGLRSFLEYIAGIGEIVIVEPQPWKCYRSAVKRMKQANFTFPLFSSLKMRETIERDIEIILSLQSLEKITESERTKWERKLLIYKYSYSNSS
ncbi:probable RNA methyltransferase CG11342 [Leptinotarsa decemlineata]|uniref:probable RNA methyltransferase CG11342 n=1 Tax=Leptinotarsa decemlineata TaxID=7539 RepID=UPI003D30D275